MGYVLTSSPYVSNLFAKQKSELNFDSNEEFLLFLLGNTSKLASIANQLNPVLNKLLDFTITDINVEGSPPHSSVDYSTTSPPHEKDMNYTAPDSPTPPRPTSADLQEILDTVNRNKKEGENKTKEEEPVIEENQDHEPHFDKKNDEDEVSAEDDRKRYHSESSMSDHDEASDSSSDSDDPMQETHDITFRNSSPNTCSSPKEEASRSSLHRESPPTRTSIEADSPPRTYQSPEHKEEDGGRMLFDPADLLQKSNAALQVSDEVMKPHSSLKPTPISSSHTIPDAPAELKTTSHTQRLVLPRQSSPFKSGHLIAVPLAISNEVKGISLPQMHHPSPGYTTISTRQAPVSSATPKPPQKDTEQNRENLNNTNEMESDASEKLYICPICNKEFKGSGRVRNCKIHINTVHLKHKPYKCNFCNTRFGYKDYMKRHLIRHHKSLFYSYGTESVLEKYTTYDLEDTASQPDHDRRELQGRDQRESAGI